MLLDILPHNAAQQRTKMSIVLRLTNCSRVRYNHWLGYIRPKTLVMGFQCENIDGASVNSQNLKFKYIIYDSMMIIHRMKIDGFGSYR